MDEIKLILKAKYGIYWEEALLQFITKLSAEEEGFHEKMVTAAYAGSKQKLDEMRKLCLNAETVAVAVSSICKDKSIHLKKNTRDRQAVASKLKEFTYYDVSDIREKFVEKVEQENKIV